MCCLLKGTLENFLGRPFQSCGFDTTCIGDSHLLSLGWSSLWSQMFAHSWPWWLKPKWPRLNPHLPLTNLLLPWSSLSWWPCLQSSLRPLLPHELSSHPSLNPHSFALKLNSLLTSITAAEPCLGPRLMPVLPSLSVMKAAQRMTWLQSKSKSCPSCSKPFSSYSFKTKITTMAFKTQYLTPHIPQHLFSYISSLHHSAPAPPTSPPGSCLPIFVLTVPSASNALSPRSMHPWTLFLLST